MAENQPNGNVLLEICAILFSQSVKTFCREIKLHFSKHCDTLGGIVTSRCIEAVGNINSTEKFHRLALRFC